MTDSNINPNGQAAPQAPSEAQQQPAQQGGDLAKRVAELEAQLKEKDGKYLYLYAEFENFKKRAVKERSDLAKYGCEPFARELLQVVDNLERALSHVPAGADKNLVDGLNMVLSQFRGVLQSQGVVPVDAVQKSFDPNLHEAVAQESSEHPEGTVVKEHTRGYTLHGRLLRPARVVVSGGQQKTG